MEKVGFLHSEYKRILYNIIVTPTQIIDAHTSGQLENDLLPNKEAQEYYNQNFKK